MSAFLARGVCNEAEGSAIPSPLLRSGVERGMKCGENRRAELLETLHMRNLGALNGILAPGIPLIAEVPDSQHKSFQTLHSAI